MASTGQALYAACVLHHQEGEVTRGHKVIHSLRDQPQARLTSGSRGFVRAVLLGQHVLQLTRHCSLTIRHRLLNPLQSISLNAQKSKHFGVYL